MNSGMTKIVYDEDTLKKMALFETMTHAKLKDFFDDPVQDRLVFIVLPGNLWRALGKESANVKKLENSFKRKIKIVEFAPDLVIHFRERGGRVARRTLRALLPAAFAPGGRRR